jgi:hypothetical protein
MKIVILTLLLCVGFSLAQVKPESKFANKKHQGEIRRQRNAYISAPYQYDVPKKPFNAQVKPVQNFQYYTAHDLPVEGKGYQFNSGPATFPPQNYYDNIQNLFPMKNQADTGFGFHGFDDFPQFSNAVNQFGNFNKLQGTPSYQSNFNYEKVKPAFSAFNYGNIQPSSYNMAGFYGHNFNPAPTQQTQYALNAPYVISNPQAALPVQVKLPEYATGYKGLSQFSSTPAPSVYDNKGLNQHSNSYSTHTSPVISFSHNQKIPAKYNSKPVYDQPTSLHTSFRGSSYKPFRGSVQILNSPHGTNQYDSYGEQSINNEKPLTNYVQNDEYSNPNQYAPPKQYLPVKEHSTEYSVPTVPLTERPTQYLTPSKTYLPSSIPKPNPYLPIKATTETPIPSVDQQLTKNNYAVVNSYSSNKYLPASSQSGVSYLPQSNQFLQYSVQSDNNENPPYATGNNNYYSYDNNPQQSQYVDYIPQGDSTKK